MGAEILGGASLPTQLLVGTGRPITWVFCFFFNGKGRLNFPPRGEEKKNQISSPKRGGVGLVTGR